MLDTSARLLRLLSLLQAQRDWTGPALARRLGVTTRTVRNDVERLRSLHYPVEGRAGVAGGYRLGAGAVLPPLLLDDEEAVAVAVGLRTAAGGTVTGMEEVALRALSKLEQMLPARLSRRVRALTQATVQLPTGGPQVDAGLLSVVAAAIRDREVVRFGYRNHDGTASRRDVEPHRLIHTGRRWYLVGWDASRRDWRTFRVDRMVLRTPNGPRFPPREPPDGGFEAYVARGLSSGTWPMTGRFLLHAPIEAMRKRVRYSEGTLEKVDAHSCILTTGADAEHFLLVVVGIFDVDFTVLDPPWLVERAAAMAERYRRASQRSAHS